MQIHVIPVNKGMTRDELAGRIQSGWIKVGRQSVQSGTTGIAKLNQPSTPLMMECDVWVLPEPTIPARVVVGAMVEAMSNSANMDTLNMVSAALFGATVTEVAEKIGIPGTEKLSEDMPIM